MKRLYSELGEKTIKKFIKYIVKIILLEKSFISNEIYRAKDSTEVSAISFSIGI